MLKVLKDLGINRLLFLLVVGALLSCSTGSVFVAHHDYFSDPRVDVKGSFLRPTKSEKIMADTQVTAAQRTSVLRALSSADPGLSLYRNPVARDMVIDYFCRLTGSQEVALSILYHADRENVPLLLAFSLAWVETRYASTAVNSNGDSVDRGIFQLNSRSFPNLSAPDFFHPDTNIEYGIEHLRYCLNLSKNETTAVEIYNAGLSTIRSGEVPPSTRQYAAKITTFQRWLARDFRSYIDRCLKKA